MTILKSQINPNDPSFLKNKRKLNIDIQLTIEAVENVVKCGSINTRK